MLWLVQWCNILYSTSRLMVIFYFEARMIFIIYSKDEGTSVLGHLQSFDPAQHTEFSRILRENRVIMKVKQGGFKMGSFGHGESNAATKTFFFAGRVRIELMRDRLQICVFEEQRRSWHPEVGFTYVLQLLILEQLWHNLWAFLFGCSDLGCSSPLIHSVSSPDLLPLIS